LIDTYYTTYYYYNNNICREEIYTKINYTCRLRY
jgi:hypothetical protein